MRVTRSLQLELPALLLELLGDRPRGLDRPLVLTNEEATDFVNRTGTAWPAGPDAEQAGLAVAYDPASGDHRSIYGLGRMNHENSVAVPGYDEAVLVTGDDTFSAPASQLYMYIADDADAVWNDEGNLWAFVSDDEDVNDYGDLGARGRGQRRVHQRPGRHRRR